MIEPLSDEELNRLLRAWKAPDPAPVPLRDRGHEPRRRPLWAWLVSGTVRVPVPLTVAAAILLLALTVSALRSSRDAPAVAQPEFQPVETVTPKLIRSAGYENPR